MQTFEEVLTHFHSFSMRATLSISMQFFAAHHKNYIRHWQMIWKQRFRSAWESTELV